MIHVDFFESKEEALKREKYHKSGRGSVRKNEIILNYLDRWSLPFPNGKGVGSNPSPANKENRQHHLTIFYLTKAANAFEREKANKKRDSR